MKEVHKLINSKFKMKKVYKKPSAEVVNVKLIGSILDDPDPGVGGYSNTTGTGDAKESTGFEEEETLPTQPNLWADDED